MRVKTTARFIADILREQSANSFKNSAPLRESSEPSDEGCAIVRVRHSIQVKLIDLTNQ